MGGEAPCRAVSWALAVPVSHMIEKLVQVDIHHTREVPIERVVEKILQVDVEHIREVPVERIVEKVPPPLTRGGGLRSRGW